MHIPFVRVLTTIFLVGGLDVEVQTNGLRKVSNLLLSDFFLWRYPKMR